MVYEWLEQRNQYCKTSPVLATGCANGRNMQHPTMLGVVGQQCYVRLHAA